MVWKTIEYNKRNLKTIIGNIFIKKMKISVEHITRKLGNKKR